MQTLRNIFWLGTKELRSFLSDWVLIGLVIWSFSFSVYTQAQSNVQELHNAAIAIVDEDGSRLSRRLAAAFLPPEFKVPAMIAERDVDRVMDTAQYTFVIDVPPHFERDVMAGRQPALQVIVDATAMMQAGIGASEMQQILTTEIGNFVTRNEGAYIDLAQGTPVTPITQAVRVAFNPNVTTAWFTGVMAIITGVITLGIILAGAAVVREREHGTLDHLLVMPVTPFEIAMAKVWANALVITLAVGLSLSLVVRVLLGIPVAGSVPLFMCGVAIFLFFTTAIGLFLGTVVRSMPQLGLLFILVAIPMMLLSGANTPVESMPPTLRAVMAFSPATHFVSFAQAILYRGAGFAIVWPEFLAVGAMGALFLGLALLRFRKVTEQTV
ncbi:MAG TPA: ABC transporter permease [Candidatus Sulfotelmatobacter sp.]|nr:ABC transporter permease [Candidatus Sulfotelmatobacter sp.]